MKETWGVDLTFGALGIRSLSMNLVIQAHTLKNEPLTQPITGRFDERGGTIGRSDSNTLALPDPERHISRLHAEVGYRNGTYSVRNIGSANIILVNGRAVAPGERSPLAEGDELTVGAYAMRVSFSMPVQARPAPSPRAAPPPRRPVPTIDDPFADVFADLPVPAGKAVPPAPVPRPYSAPDGAAPPRLAPFPPDVHETTMPAMRVTRPRPEPEPDGGASDSSPLPRAGGHAPPAPTWANSPELPLTPEALWAAFCDGAGIEHDPAAPPTLARMRLLGEVLRQSVEGTLKLVTVRTLAREELRAPVSTLQSRQSNPLKTSPDAATALAQLVQPPARGVMAGPQAVEDVMDDLLGHAIGTMAGMRAAAAGVLSRFEPDLLEAQLGQGGVIDNLLPGTRRARLWEMYLAHFERLQSDAESQFHELFDTAFIRAYEDELDRIDRARHPED